MTWQEFATKHKISENYQPNEQIIYMAWEAGQDEKHQAVKETLEKVKTACQTQRLSSGNPSYHDFPSKLIEMVDQLLKDYEGDNGTK